jgi:outer membrane lipoprotein
MKWFLLIYTVFLCACSNLPENIKNPPVSDIQLHQVLSNKAKYDNKPVRWGGTITHIVKAADDMTLQIQFYPLSRHGYPEMYIPSFGHFIVTSNHFNDSDMVSEGTVITVAGSLQGVVEQQIDDKIIQLPIVKMDNHHIWKRSHQVYSDYGQPYKQRCQPWRAKPGQSGKKFCIPTVRHEERIGSFRFGR